MRRVATIIAVMGMAGSVPAHADNLDQSPEIYFPNSGPHGNIIVHKDDVVLHLPIMFAVAARIEQPVHVVVDGENADIAAGTLLPEVDLVNLVQLAFCTPLKHGERDFEHGLNKALFGGGMLVREMAVHASSAQFCLSTAAGGGRLAASGGLDEIRYFHHSWPGGSPPQKIDPIHYTTLTNVPVSDSGDDEVRVTATHVGADSLSLKIDIVQAGQARMLTSLTTAGEETKHTVNIDLRKPMPIEVRLFGIDLEVVAIDSAKKEVTLRVPDNADRQRVEKIPEYTQFKYHFGY